MELRLCKKCGLMLPISSFYHQKNKPKGDCKKCRIIEQARWREQHRGLAHQYAESRKLRGRHAIDSIKRNGACADCGITGLPECCMEFDHIRQKKLSISNAINDGYSIDTIKKEIAECQLVCIRCHRLRTKKRLGEQHYRQEKREKRRQYIDQLKSESACSVCGGRFESCQMDFHHLDPSEKVANIAQMISYKDERMLAEISKCVIMCALCHRLEELQSAAQRP